MYIGATDCLNQYRLLRSRAELATYTRHRVVKESNVPLVIYSDGMLEVHNTTLDKIDLRIDGVFMSPMELPTYNEDLSDFPMDEKNIVELKQLILRAELGQEAATPSKIKQDNLDISATK
jgi:hypothetical protein